MHRKARVPHVEGSYNAQIMSVLETIRQNAYNKGEKLELIQEGAKSNKDNMCWKHTLPDSVKPVLGEARTAVLEILNDLCLKSTSVPLFEAVLVDPTKSRKPAADKSKTRESTEQVPNKEPVSFESYSAVKVAQSVQQKT